MQSKSFSKIVEGFKFFLNNVIFLNPKVPASVDKNSDKRCDLKIVENGEEITRTFDYKVSLSPLLSSVSPMRGGTGGGTLLTITGSGFP